MSISLAFKSYPSKAFRIITPSETPKGTRLITKDMKAGTANIAKQVCTKNVLFLLGITKYTAQIASAKTRLTNGPAKAITASCKYRWCEKCKFVTS